MISISKHHNASTDSWIKLESGVYAVIAQDFLIWYGESSALVQTYSAMVREGNFHVLLCRLCVFQDPPQISFCMCCVLISWPPSIHGLLQSLQSIAVYWSFVIFGLSHVPNVQVLLHDGLLQSLQSLAVYCSFAIFWLSACLPCRCCWQLHIFFLSDIRRLFIHGIEVASTVTQGKDLAQAKGMFWEFRVFCIPIMRRTLDCLHI
jgi:hypothetical protein